MKKILLTLVVLGIAIAAQAVDLKRCRIVVASNDVPLVHKMATVLSEDIERVTGIKPAVVGRAKGKQPTVVLATVDDVAQVCPDVMVEELCGTWERYKIVTRGERLIIVGSDARGLAYGVLHVSEAIGVNPWYWWADVPVTHHEELDYAETFTSTSPSVKFRGIFINDEDWGLKTWASRNFERELNDIGPKTYDKVCELLLRLKGNMLAPAMHSCTGAFYVHPESQRRAAEWGIMITTSHCEPMLVNNAAKSEWDSAVDGEWNYATNRDRIYRRFDDRLRETAQYDNIYTTGMRGLHDAAMQGSTDPKVRARTLEQVITDQREILARHKKRAAKEIPQIFVPYKEALDIYDAGLRVPEDITLVWPDDNYGYMKRVSNDDERQRSGRSGVYYHISYLGTPHDNLWIATTAPMLMYTELKKAYDSGADRYWLLNVGDIKPMELEMQQFFDMAWNMSSFSYDNANRYQAEWLEKVFRDSGFRLQDSGFNFQDLLDDYYRLAWQRKPEFMGYEWEWDSKENQRLHDTDFSFADGTAQKRMADYQRISDQVDAIERVMPAAYRPAFFEFLGFSVKSAYQMNRKFMMAQRNHETGSAEAAADAREAYDSIQVLMKKYNTMLDGKWNQMMSEVPPGMCANYQQMPELVDAPTDSYRLPDDQRHITLPHRIDLRLVKASAPFRLVEGIGTDWIALQMGEPMDEVQDPSNLDSSHIEIPFEFGEETSIDSLRVCISVVPFWPIDKSRSNRLGISLDGCTPVVCENKFTEWSYPWKLQVLENRHDFLVTLPFDTQKHHHTLSLIVGDPGQMVQGISFAPVGER